MAEESSLSSLKRKFDDQLTCSVCLDQYTNPKILPCHHSFCLECIEPLPIEIEEKKFFIKCPTCRVSHQLPEGGANCLQCDFKINSLLVLRQEMPIKMNCQKHDDPLKVYCETCHEVICRDCTISKEHKEHKFELISECYAKHHQEIQTQFDLLKHKTTDINTAVTALDTREREMVEQGENVKKQIQRHAQQLMNQIQESEKHLLQQVDTVVQQKRNLLAKQRGQAEKIHTKLKTCQEKIQKKLDECSQTQVMIEKEDILRQMKTASKNVKPTVFQPIEEVNTKFTEENIRNEIGRITSHRYGKAILKTAPCSPNIPSSATLTLQSCDGSPFSLFSSFISCKLSSTCSSSKPIKCHISHTHQGEYCISFTSTTIGAYQLIVQVGGIGVPGSPFTFPSVPSSVIEGRPVKTIGGLNMPWGIAINSNGYMVVTECGAHCVTIFNKNQENKWSFGTEGTKEGEFINPSGVAFSTDGHILVTDEHRLQKLNFDGVCVKSVGSSKVGTGQLEFHSPAGIAVHPTMGDIFVADSSNACIKVFKNDLTFSHTITLLGDRSFNGPCDVSLDGKGQLFVVECRNNCITKLTTTGQYITRFGSYGTAPGQLYRPCSLTIYNNLVYVSDSGNHRVSIFDTKGTYIYSFGNEGNEVKFNSLRGIASDTFGNLYVCEPYMKISTNRILMF